jgi:hypothetical protein
MLRSIGWQKEGAMRGKIGDVKVQEREGNSNEGIE